MYSFDHLDAATLAQRVGSGDVSEETVAAHFLECVDAQESTIQAFVSFNPDAVRAQARQLARARVRGPLAGIPVGVKDNYDTVDHPTGFYSPIYEDNCPSRDAHVVSLLRQAGALIMGKTHTTEFAYMHTGPTRNPPDTQRTPGSSSAGSAAGLAAGFFPIALGTQTAGSLIKPAAYCGVHAFKPTMGWSRLRGSSHWRPVSTRLGGLGVPYGT